MQEKSLRITGADKTFFNKLTNTLTKLLIPTRVGINSILISGKRNNVLKAFENFELNENKEKSQILEDKYEQSYTAYLEALDRYVMDSIYKKVKQGTATEFEKQALSHYYEVIRLKENEYIEYKYRKQKYLIELDKESVLSNNKDKIKDKYIKFYVSKMEALYKGILKNYSVKLADTTNIYDSSKEWIYTKIFYTLSDYAENILDLKLEIQNGKEIKELKEDYARYEKYIAGKLDTRDTIEKNVVLVGMSRKVFTHSLPLIVIEQCYTKLLKDARALVQDTKIAPKRERAYALLLDVFEEYYTKLLSTKIYWNNQQEKEEFKELLNKYNEILKLKEVSPERYETEREILFIKYDIKKIKNDISDYSRIIIYYKRKLADYGAIKQLKNRCKSEGKYIKVNQAA